MPNTLKDYQSNVMVGLGTWTYTTSVASLFFVQATSSENPPSGLVLMIKQNGTTMATSTAPSATQGAVDTLTLLNCAQGDVITVVISSSVPIDQQLNTVKTIIVLRQGQ